MLATAAVLNQIMANDGALGSPIHKKPPARIVPNGITLEGDAVSCHGLGFRPPVNPTHLVTNNGILLNKIVAVLVSDGHPIPSVALEPVTASNTTPHPPAEEKPILIVGDRSAVGHRGSLGTTSRMQAKAGTPLHHTLIHLHIIGLLKTDSIPHVASNRTMLNHAVIAPVEVDPRSAAPVHLGGIVFSIAIHPQMLHARILNFIATDHWVNGGGKPAIRHHDVSIHGAGQSQIGVLSIEDRRTHPVEIALGSGGHVNPTAQPKSGGIFKRHSGLAIVAIGTQRAAILAFFFQNGLVPSSSHGDTAAQVQGIPHRVGPGADLHHAASKLANIINGRLQGPMILADDIRIVLAHTNHHCRTGMQFVLGILATCLVPKADSDRQGDPPSKARKKRFHRRSLPQTKGQLLGQSRSIIHPHPKAETTNDRPRLL